MAALDLKDRAAVLVFLLGELPKEDPGALEALLDASAAHTCSEPHETVYRPWWVIANSRQSATGQAESVKSASGAGITYANPTIMLRGVLTRQAALDAALCGVPPGFEARIPGGAGSARLIRS